MHAKKERLIVGISGGVDSAVAALLLLRQGHRVSGLFMKNWEEDDEEGYCSAAEDLAAAREVAAQLGIPLETINLSADYWERVFSHFLAEQRAGRTPNPDTLCNREIKFGPFLEHAGRLGADAIATGHYVASDQTIADGWRLLRGRDQAKDQSYFLHLLNQKQLAASRFPLGELTKEAVRKLATDSGLHNADRRDSTGICFIGERPFRDFVGRYIKDDPGPIVSADGHQIGEHRGLHYYTIGQRRGLGIGGLHGKSEDAWYVAAKDRVSKRLWVVQGGNHPWLLAGMIVVGSPHWIGPHPELPLECEVRLRHRHQPVACTVRMAGEASLLVHFKQPQRAATPGQSAVFYLGRNCLGGGIIEGVDCGPMPHPASHSGTIRS